MITSLSKVFVNDTDRTKKPLVYQGKPYRKVTLVLEDGRKAYSEDIYDPNDPILRLTPEMRPDLDLWNDKAGYWRFKLMGASQTPTVSPQAPQSVVQPQKDITPAQAIAELLGALGTTDEKLDKLNELLVKVLEKGETPF